MRFFISKWECWKDERSISFLLTICVQNMTDWPESVDIAGTVLKYSSIWVCFIARKKIVRIFGF